MGKVKNGIDYQSLKLSIDKQFLNILNSIPKTFTSADFITAVHKFLPEEYGNFLKNFKSDSKKPLSSYTRLHQWIAGYYLKTKVTAGFIKRTGERRTILTVNNTPSKNMIWKKK